jgi:hypothetical protein
MQARSSSAGTSPRSKSKKEKGAVADHQDRAEPLGPDDMEKVLSAAESSKWRSESEAVLGAEVMLPFSRV